MAKVEQRIRVGYCAKENRVIKHLQHVRHSVRSSLPTREGLQASLLDARRTDLLGAASGRLAPSKVAIPQHWYRRSPNFGDVISPFLTEFVSGHRARWVGTRTGSKLLGLGSIAQSARPGDVVWGSGAIDMTGADLSRSTVLAVRGPLTREASRGDIPEVYGDPALLLPLAYQPRAVGTWDVGVIPHYAEFDLLEVTDPRVKLIDVRNPDWRTTVDEICSCSFVASSSLHGVIVAEAYGIPATWFSACDRVIGHGFKFRDFYASTNRESHGPHPWESGLLHMEKGLDTPPVMDPTPLLDSWPTEWKSPAALQVAATGSTLPS